VQSADFFNLLLEAKKSEFLERQFVELLIQQSPTERTQVFATLEEAIAKHDEEFNCA
jgi:hypothetical protein